MKRVSTLFTLSHSQISRNRIIQRKRRSFASLLEQNMKTFIVVLVVCLSCGAYGDDKKPAKAIAVLGLSDKVFGSE
jgi:translation initiation factor 2 beta subunit (eIF-2beta)/eIF-5